MAGDGQDDGRAGRQEVLLEDHADFVRESVRWVAEQLMEAEVSELVGAELGERAPEDRRRIATAIGRGGGTRGPGRSSLQIPKLRRGSYFPCFLQPRKRSEQALVAVVQQAYVCGRLDAEGRPAGRDPRAADRRSRGLADLRGPGRAGRGVPHPAAWRAATPICGSTRKSRRSATAAGWRASAW